MGNFVPFPLQSVGGICLTCRQVTRIRILGSDLHLARLTTRLPFRYGIATMTDVPQAYVRLAVEIDGIEVKGTSSDLLPPKWFTKDPSKEVFVEIDEMLQTIKSALQASAGMTGVSAF